MMSTLKNRLTFLSLKSLTGLFSLCLILSLGCDDSDDQMLIYPPAQPGPGVNNGVNNQPTTGNTTPTGGTSTNPSMPNGGSMSTGNMMMGGGTDTNNPMTGAMMNMGGNTPEPLTAECEGIPADQVCETQLGVARNPNLSAVEILVSIEGVVTAVRYNDEGNLSHVVLQDPSRTDGYHGLWVYMNDTEVDLDTAPTLVEGRRVRMVGETEDYFGQRQLRKVSAITDLGVSAIQPQVVQAVDVKTQGTLAEQYEGVLVQINDAVVESLNPAAGPGDDDPTQEFVIQGGLRVNDFLHSFELPAQGQQYRQLIGILRLGNGDYKLEPRNANDFVQ